MLSLAIPAVGGGRILLVIGLFAVQMRRKASKPALASADVRWAAAPSIATRRAFIR